jgi:hypothetical protein
MMERRIMDTLETQLSTRPHNIAPEEWAVRVDLAACYRLIAHFGWDDLILTHNSARVPGEPNHFLINPMGLMFDEITASNLLKMDPQCNLSGPPGCPVCHPHSYRGRYCGRRVGGGVIAAEPVGDAVL